MKSLGAQSIEAVPITGKLKVKWQASRYQNNQVKNMAAIQMISMTAVTRYVLYTVGFDPFARRKSHASCKVANIGQVLLPPLQLTTMDNVFHLNMIHYKLRSYLYSTTRLQGVKRNEADVFKRAVPTLE